MTILGLVKWTNDGTQYQVFTGATTNAHVAAGIWVSDSGLSLGRMALSQNSAGLLCARKASVPVSRSSETGLESFMSAATFLLPWF